MTKETLKHLNLNPEQLSKLMMQDASPTKYQNPNNGILSPLIDSQYVVQHNKKVKQLEQKVS